jgi:hypothetical protein
LWNIYIARKAWTSFKLDGKLNIESKKGQPFRFSDTALSLATSCFQALLGASIFVTDPPETPVNQVAA